MCTTTTDAYGNDKVKETRQRKQEDIENVVDSPIIKNLHFGNKCGWVMGIIRYISNENERNQNQDQTEDEEQDNDQHNQQADDENVKIQLNGVKMHKKLLNVEIHILLIFIHQQHAV